MSARVLLCLLAVLLFGCRSVLEKKIIGFYSIDKITYKEQDIIHDLGVNLISFKKNRICNLPPLQSFSSIKLKIKEGNWSINETDTTLVIVADHVVFNGVYKVSFKKDYEKKLLKLVLESDNTYLIASKGLQHFDSRKDDW